MRRWPAPRWAYQMELRILSELKRVKEEIVSDINQAEQDITTAVQGASDEISKLADEVRSGADTTEVANRLEALAGQLNTAVSGAETPPAPPAP